MTWIKKDLSKRKGHVPDLLTCVRLPLLSAEFLMDTVRKEVKMYYMNTSMYNSILLILLHVIAFLLQPLIKSFENCRDMLEEALGMLLVKNKNVNKRKQPKPGSLSLHISLYYNLSGYVFNAKNLRYTYPDSYISARLR